MSHSSRFDGSKCWAVVPAAGIGSRMQADCPKQYLPLAGKTIIENTLDRLQQCSSIEEIVVAVSPFDERWSELEVSRRKNITTVEGGQERSESVLNALRALQPYAEDDDWILVHDAARPCVSVDSIQGLFDACEDHTVGGILGVPVTDTIKRINVEFGIEETVDRRVLWHAQTPQLFRYSVLLNALKRAERDNFAVTDESSAVEYVGLAAKMVEGSGDNIKVTRPEDLALAAMILERQASSS